MIDVAADIPELTRWLGGRKCCFAALDVPNVPVTLSVDFDTLFDPGAP